MKTINSKTLLLSAVVLLLPVFLQAQYATYYGRSLDHTYLTVENVTAADNPQYDDGYIISTTVFSNGNSSVPVRGEITRTDLLGGLHWVNEYTVTPSSLENRFNHITKYSFNGSVEYLVVGSIIDGTGSTTLMIATIDDNGAVLASQELSSGTYAHLVGIKGIVTSDDGFAIVAMETTGFGNLDDKNIVILKLDNSLTLQSSMTVTSTTITRDYDTPTDIIEGDNPEEFFIVGTSNKDVNSLSCGFAALVEPQANTVHWSYNFSTALGAHWDVGADAFYNGNRLWVLANSSIIHYFNLIELEPSTGAVLNVIQFSDVTYGNDFDHYGFELKESLNNPDEHLVISGWKSLYATNAVQPFLLEVNPFDGSIAWQWKYDGYINNQMALNENSWLRVGAAGQFSFYFNDMMTYRPNREGYAMLTANATDPDQIWLWFGTDLTGNVLPDCGYDPPLGDSIPPYFPTNNPLTTTTDNTQIGMDGFLNETDVTYYANRCGEDAKFKNGGTNSLEENAINAYKVYPNPATHTLFVRGEDIKEVTLTDMFGRKILTQKVNAQTQTSLNTSNVKTGIYIINITTTGGDIKTQRVEIVQ